jgi:hypothetical protein
MAITAEQAEAELRRRGVLTGGDTSVLAPKEEKTTLTEVKNMVESLFKGSAKGIINLVGGWGNLYDELKKSKDPSAFSSQGIVNTIANMGGPDLMKIQGWKGVYKFAEAGTPSAAMAVAVPGSSLFNLSTPARTAAGEFAAGGTLGTAAQMVAPESPYAQVTIQSLPYLVKGGVSTLKDRAQQKKIDEYVKLLPDRDKNIFEEFILKGQGTSDPVIASDIMRLAASPKYAELIATLNSGAAARAVEGMQPAAGRMTAKDSTVSIVQAIKNKLDGLRESKAEGLFEKAKQYGEGNELVDTTATINNIDKLLVRYSNMATPNAEKAVNILNSIRERLAPADDRVRNFITNEVIPGKKLTVEQAQGLMSEFGKKASQGDQLIKDLSITDEKIISSAIFGGLKDDLLTSFNGATGADKTALGLLRQARDRTQKSADAYREAIAQGLPSWLKDKSLAEIAPEELFDKYQKLTPEQRTYARQLVADTDQEALAFLDRKVYDNFINSAKRPNIKGEESVDLGELAANWKKLSDNDKDALMAALGTSKDEFSKRMTDAAVFSNRAKLAKPSEEGIFAPEQVRETQAAAGAVGSYSLAKVTQLAMDTFNMMTKNGLSEDQLAKILFTTEGKNFLSTARMSPRGQETLNALTALDNAKPPSIMTRFAGQAGRVGARAGQADQPQVPMEQPTEPTEMAPAISPEEAMQELQRRGIQVPME